VDQRRRGAVIPMAATLIAVLLGMVAFAVDIGWIALTRSELQNAADASALAGVKPLMDGHVQYNLPGQTQCASILATAQTNARALAKQYAAYHTAGGVSGLVLQDNDIEFGFTDASGNYTPLPTYTGFPNTIKVTLRRDSVANGPLQLYFGPVLGMSTTNVIATASATAYGGTVDSFQSNANRNIAMLPLTYDVNHWNNFVQTGLDPDGNLTLYNGSPALQVYPSIKAPGNFGQLSLDDSHVGESTEAAWVTGGMSSTDMQGLTSNGLIPLSKHDPTKWDWVGDTGMKQSLVGTINAQAGRSFYLPLFTPYDNGVPNPATYSAGTGQGSHYYYNIVQFVGVTIVPNGTGGVTVQPSAVIDPNAVFASAPVPAGSSGQLITTFTSPKLTR
jgi:Flp pilus assembly protein TadG